MTATTQGRRIRIGEAAWPEAAWPKAAWSETALLKAGNISVRAAPDLQIVYDDTSELVIGDTSDLVIHLRGRAAPRSGSKIDDLAKRALDIVVAASALVISLPVWVVVSVAAGRRESGPILFSQQRIGQGGRMFRCWKFRTMRIDADEVLDRLLQSDPDLARQWNDDHKLDEDPRVTKLGRILRRFDLDEIPQFVNILIGDMSIVGPRPVVLKEAPRFAEQLPTVLSVRPGLTGAWQVSGRNSMTYAERVQQEAEYVATRSFLGDLVICARTPLALLRRNGGR